MPHTYSIETPTNDLAVLIYFGCFARVTAERAEVSHDARLPEECVVGAVACGARPDDLVLGVDVGRCGECPAKRSEISGLVLDVGFSDARVWIGGSRGSWLATDQHGRQRDRPCGAATT